MHERTIATLLMTFLLAACAGSNGATHGQTARIEGSAAGVSSEDCPIVGHWRGIVPGGLLQGSAMVLEFFDDGTSIGRADWVTLESTWERDGNTVAIAGVRANPPMASCPADQVGRYTIAFEGGCDAVRVISGEDECNHRRLALLGLGATRQQ